MELEKFGSFFHFFNLNFIWLFGLLISWLFLERKYLRLFEKETENVRDMLINETQKHGRAIRKTQLRLPTSLLLLKIVVGNYIQA